MILVLVAALQVGLGTAPAPAAADSLPRVTLAEALRAATRLDPDYVRMLGRIDNAEWGRRAAISALVLPALTASVDASRFSTEFFNIGTGQPQQTSVIGRIEARYTFSGATFSELGRSRAELEASGAAEVDQRFRTALETEADYYQVLQNQELLRVTGERVRRAEEALGVARARVLSGAAVQSDSLQLVLELLQARFDQMSQSASLRVSRMQLGRRVGVPGPVDAVPLDSIPAGDLPLTLPEAVSAALDAGPAYQVARANERVASAALRSERGRYLPQLTLSAVNNRYDVSFFPSGRNVSSISLGVTVPIWDQARREIAVTQARVNRDVAQAIRADLERGVRRDVTEAYEAYATAQFGLELSRTGVVAAQENFRVQETRYRAGATTILDLLDAQIRLAQAQAAVVQSRYAVQLAVAGVEAILGRRLYPDRNLP